MTEAGQTTPVLSVDGLTIDLAGPGGQRGLVQDVSFDVPRGGSVALIGESGCGKTLTAMSILGLLPPRLRATGGAIRFEGTDLLTASRRTLRGIRGGPVGMVFQDPMSSLNPTMTVGDQIGEARRLHLGESRRQSRLKARELLDRVGIANAARRVDVYPFELSGGMQQRVMIAAAIACDPRLVIADEPTTALDVTIQAEILELLRDLQRDMGLAVLLVTHDLGVVADFCDDVVVMYAGHVVERAAVGPLFAAPQHPYTRALLDSVPQSGRAHTPLDVIPGRVPPAGSFPTGCRFRPRCGYAVEPACTQPQPEYQPEPGHRCRCVRVGTHELTLEAAR
jgi:oligopeptide/dipeptide ABC transporter ATP-binding protein